MASLYRSLIARRRISWFLCFSLYVYFVGRRREYSLLRRIVLTARDQTDVRNTIVAVMRGLIVFGIAVEWTVRFIFKFPGLLQRFPEIIRTR